MKAGWASQQTSLQFRDDWRLFGLWRARRLFFRRQLFPIAPFLNAGVDRADLGLLFHDEWGAALRAWLGKRHIR